MHDGLKIFFDAGEKMPNGFDLHVKSAQAAIQLIREGKVALISIGNYSEENSEGKNLARLITQVFIAGEIDFVAFETHTSNATARKQIAMFKDSIIKHLQAQLESDNETGFQSFLRFYVPSIEQCILQLAKRNIKGVTFEELFEAGVSALKKALAKSKDEDHFNRFYLWWVKQEMLGKIRDEQNR